MKPCDIIIPIYNAYDCLQPCIDSIIANTKWDNNKVILINDKSKDERVKPLLQKYAENYEFISYYENEENLGFVGTVNRGMQMSHNDVLLLNSDTEVTKNWLEKIQKCAYSMTKVATVTPLSNNATLASVPNIFEANTLPKGIDLQEMGEIVEKCSYEDYPEIPTGHGFCLYIRRDALEEVGLFDQETYGKGYGEENDFCFRCLDAGYRNLLCDNTYILHKESQSFSESKSELIEQGLTALKEKYPIYKDRLDSWCEKKDISYLGENVALHIGTLQTKPNVLFIIHDWKNIKSNLGGTSLHVWDIICNLREYYNFHVLAPEDGIYKLYSYWASSEMETTVTFPEIIQYSIFPFYSSAYRKMLENIIDTYKINIVHVHHLKGNYFDLMDVIKEKNLFSIMTLHDYYSVCPTINKLYKNEKYCENSSETLCSECCQNECTSCSRGLATIKAWRHEWHNFLEKFDLLIAPSEAAKQEILMHYDDLNICVVEHGIDYPKVESNLTIDSNETLDIAFVGAIGIHKGSNILLDLIKYIKGKNIRIHLFGTVDQIITKNNKNFINHGKYKREELPNLLKENNIKVICLLSPWPETFSYTLSESIAGGVPVLAFDFGAIAERIKKYGLGWVLPSNATTKDIVDTLKHIQKDPTSYQNIVSNINQYQFKTTKNMAKEYQKIYDTNINAIESVNVSEIKRMLKESKKVCVNVTYSNYEWVFNTLKWKMVSKLKIPQSIKKIFRSMKK